MKDICKLLQKTVVSQAAAVTGRVVERLTEYDLLNRSSLGTRTSGERILTLRSKRDPFARSQRRCAVNWLL